MEEKLKAEEEERRKRDPEKLRKETRIKNQEVIGVMQTADELRSEGTSKLQAALSSGHKVQKLMSHD